MDEDDKKDLVSCYLNFRLAYESRGGGSCRNFETVINATANTVYTIADIIRFIANISSNVIFILPSLIYSSAINRRAIFFL